MKRNLRRRCSGQLIAITALLIPGLLAIAGLALDGGMVYQVKRRMQTAADAAALGGAMELFRGLPEGVVAAARNDARLNGFQHEVNANVQVNRPPTSGTRAGNTLFVEVIISRNVPTTFLRVINRNLTLVRARAVAGLVNYADGCVMALDPNDFSALTVAGASTLNASCGVIVNSNDEQAIVANGGGCIYASEVGVTGGWVTNGTANCIEPPPETEIPPALDPLATMAAPPIPISVTASNFSATGGTATMAPGLYRGGININGGNVAFQPGVYILDGGGLTIGGNAVVSGNGVTFYTTSIGSGGPGAPGQWGSFQIDGTATVDFRAPDSGPYEGMLFWMDRQAPNTPPVYSTITGTAGSRFEGAIYIPSTQVTFAGTSAATAWTMIIANTIAIAGNARVNSNYDASTIQPPTFKATLVE